MKLVDDAKNWWKWHSTYIYAVMGIFPLVWLNSPELQAMLPPTLVSKLAPVLAGIGFFLRLRSQAGTLPALSTAPQVPKPFDSNPPEA